MKVTSFFHLKLKIFRHHLWWRGIKNTLIQVYCKGSKIVTWHVFGFQFYRKLDMFLVFILQETWHVFGFHFTGNLTSFWFSFYRKLDMFLVFNFTGNLTCFRFSIYRKLKCFWYSILQETWKVKRRYKFKGRPFSP